MIRRAFTLRLEPGALAQYKEHHDNIWPELVAEIEKAGIGSMTAFVTGDTVFYYSEITDADAWDRLWHTEVHDRWGELFKPLMAFNDEGIVDAGDLTEIFHLETGAEG
jgi:L-rhamnose mutarotase